MFLRTAQRIATKYLTQYPVLFITGPRQSGKTTLAQSVSSDKKYVNLEGLQSREFAENDPIGFLNQFPNGAILDEVQRVPKLLSELQVRVDQQKKNGLFILTGSHQAELHAAVAQSLAGRVGLLKLLPLSSEELVGTSSELKTTQLDSILFQGFYPKVINEKLNPTQAYGAYVETYLEKDLRQITQIRDLSLFQKFLRLCAGRTGQLLNIDQLANDTGVSSTTIRHWLSALEASFIIFLLKPYHRNIGKRLIKAPKLFFHDVGIASFLLGIENRLQLQTHPLRGHLFENLIISDLMKARLNRGYRENLFFFRDHSGNEIDLLLEIAGSYLALEVKSAQTIDSSIIKGFEVFAKIEKQALLKKIVVYAGSEKQQRQQIQYLPFVELIELYKNQTNFFPAE